MIMKDIEQNNNWTPLAQQVLRLAERHAQEHGHKMVSTAHLLVGLCRLGQGVHVEPLRKQGFDESKCLEEADEIAKQQAAGVQGELDYSSALIGVARRAQEIAGKLHHQYVGTEHLALALLQAGDEVGSLLVNSYNLEASQLERDILEELRPNVDPIRRFVRLVLFGAQRDHATDVVLAPATDGGTAIRYKIDGTWHDWSPARSVCLWSRVAAEVERLAGFREGPFPKEGTIDLAYSVVIRLRWRIRMTSADAECILTRIGE
jgi:type II secretory ATPase GspE/PulE/Tfp pilus assembly ATPase PilB-like protein